MEGAEISGRSRNTWREQYYWLLHVFILLPGISAPSMYSYFFPVFLLPLCIPTFSLYFCSLYVFLLLLGISAPSIYAYFFLVFLVTPYIFFLYSCLLHAYLPLPDIYDLSMYFYFFPVFLLSQCVPISSRYFGSLHVFLLLRSISAPEIGKHGGSRNTRKT
jgi:hypothetical protein